LANINSAQEWILAHQAQIASEFHLRAQLDFSKIKAANLIKTVLEFVNSALEYMYGVTIKSTKRTKAGKTDYKLMRPDMWGDAGETAPKLPIREQI